MPRRLLILTAVLPEAAPLARRLGLQEVRDGTAAPRFVQWESSDNTKGIFLAATGMGAENAARVARELIASLRPEGLIVAGFCGALNPELQPGDLVEPSEVLNLATGARLNPSSFNQAPFTRPLRLLLTHHQVVSDPLEKQELAMLHAADAVDMETAILGQICEDLSLDWMAIRAVSDGADETLPPELAGLVDSLGRPSIWAALGLLARKPLLTPRLMKLAASTSLAGRNLASRVAELVDSFIG